MTRWARSGNTQKHKKMPGDATSWEEFSTAAKMKTASKGGNVNQILKGRIEKKKHNLKRILDLEDSKKFVKQIDYQSTKASEVKDLLSNEVSKSKFSKKKKLSNSSENEGFEYAVESNSPVDESASTDNIQKDEIRKISTNAESAFPGIENSTFTTKVLTKRQLKKAKSKMKIIALDIMSSSNPDCKVVKNQEMEVSADNKASSEVILRDESTNMVESIETDIKDFDIGSNYAPPTKVLTKLQLKKAKSKMKLIALDILRSDRYDCKVADNQDSENVTESYNSLLTATLEKKKIKNSKKNKRNQRRMSENTVDVSLDANDVEIMDQEDQMQKKSMDNSVEALNNVLSKNETSKCDATTEVKRLTKNQWRKARIRKKFELLKAIQASEVKDDKLDNLTDSKSPMSTSEKDSADKKIMFSEKLQKKKQQNAKIIFPSNVVNKISDLKKSLVEKGMSAKQIRDIVRKERKNEKLKFKRRYSSKPCFNCRKIGHFLSDCPLPLGDSTQVTGVCFKCGSTEHTSYKCQKKVKGYPLANCFICKEKGHISKDCPKNEHGIYINGGKCTLCGNVNHLSKDCPSIKKEKDNVVTIDTINEGLSVDAETCQMIEPVLILKNNFHKKKGFKF